jgi:hypothetical protein
VETDSHDQPIEPTQIFVDLYAKFADVSAEPVAWRGYVYLKTLVLKDADRGTVHLSFEGGLRMHRKEGTFLGARVNRLGLVDEIPPCLCPFCGSPLTMISPFRKDFECGTIEDTIPRDLTIHNYGSFCGIRSAECFLRYAARKAGS